MIKKKYRHLASLGLFAIFLCFCTGCSEEKIPPGVVALVNGEPITLHEVQAILDSKSANYSLQPNSSFEAMRKNYGDAISTLVATTLVRQELAQRGMAPTETDINQAFERISSEYGQDNLEQFLDDTSLRLDDWKLLMRDHLALEVFRNQVLLPGIKIEFQEVKNYYQEHKKDFLLPETARTCFLASKKKEEIADWCKNISASSFGDDSIAQCVEMAISEIPQPWSRDLKTLKAMSCGKMREIDGEWQAIALLEKQPERVPELSEVFPLVEKLLLEPRQNAAFDQWVAKKTATAKVLMAPGLLEAMLLETPGESMPAPEEEKGN